MATIIDPLPNGVGIHLVDREQLRFHGKKQMTYSDSIQGFVTQPTPPPTFDWSKGETLKFPILGNDQYADCYYAAIAHGSQAFCGNAGNPITFDVNALTARYRKLSGGDNGLDDATAMPEWKGGIIGPNGPHKILDDVQVDQNNDDAIAQAMWAFCGLIWTCLLLPNWMPSRTHAGSVWTADGRPNPRAGHAMYLTGRDASGNYDVRTWGLSPCVKLTPAGMKAGDSELLVAFSMDMFNPAGYAPCGLHYVDLAPLWQSIGGKALPASPFPAPDPGTVTYFP